LWIVTPDASSYPDAWWLPRALRRRRHPEPPPAPPRAKPAAPPKAETRKPEAARPPAREPEPEAVTAVHTESTGPTVVEPRPPAPAAAEAATPPPPAAPPPPAEVPPREPGPAFIGPLESALRQPLFVIVPFLVLLGLAAVVGLARNPTYTSKARISVGRVDVPAYTFEGVVQGNATLASGYARAIGAAAVLTDAAKQAGVTPEEAAGRLSATPVPGSTLIRVDAHGPNAKSSTRLANAGARALIDYVSRTQKDLKSTGLVAEYRKARLHQTVLRRRLTRLISARHPKRAVVDKARVDLDLAGVRSRSFRDQLTISDLNSANGSPLQLLVPANGASSDRNSNLQQILLIGGGAGLVLGFALALLMSNRRLLRRRPT
jgi:hypothetical protein